MSNEPIGREEFEHVKRFLLLMDGSISSIKIKLAVQKYHADAGGPYMNRYSQDTLIKDVSAMMIRAWRRAFNQSERFPSMADWQFMVVVVARHFEPILHNYGLDEDTTQKIITSFGTKLASERHAGEWAMVNQSGRLRRHIIPSCRQTDSQEVAADNFLTFSSQHTADIGAELSTITAECVKAMMVEVSRNIQLAESSAGAKRALSFLAMRSMQLGMPVPPPVMALLMSDEPDTIAETIFHLPIDFSLGQLTGDARRQFSELLSRASLSPGADLMFTVQFPDLNGETMERIMEGAKEGRVTYI